MNWSKTEINHMRVSLNRCNAQQLADELGRSKIRVKEKLAEIKLEERLAKICENAKKLNFRD